MKLCDYDIPQSDGTTRGCQNPMKFVVHFTTPDDGTSMRHRDWRHRCHWHADEKSLPVGATQIVAQSPNWPAPPRAGGGPSPEEK